MADPARRNEPARRRLPPEERRAQLLDVALEVFARQGLGAAGHASVAREAGVAVSTVFLYFPTREALRDAVLDEVARFYEALVERNLAPPGSAEERLRRLAQAFVASLERDLLRALVWLDWSTHFREDVWARFLAMMEGIVRRCEAVLREDRKHGRLPAQHDAEAAARVFIGAAPMFVHMRLLGAGATELDRITETLLGAALA